VSNGSSPVYHREPGSKHHVISIASRTARHYADLLDRHDVTLTTALLDAIPPSAAGPVRLGGALIDCVRSESQM